MTSLHAHTPRQKEKALSLLTTHTLKEVAKKMGISYHTLRSWRKAAKKGEEHPRVKLDPRFIESLTIKELRREVDTLKRKIEILKPFKAAYLMFANSEDL